MKLTDKFRGNFTGVAFTFFTVYFIKAEIAQYLNE